MIWTKTPAELDDDPRLESAGLEASWLYICCWTYSARKLTDGRISRERLTKFANVRQGLRAASRLVEVGIAEWEDQDLVLTEFHTVNPTASTVLSRRKSDRERKDKQRKSGRTGGGTDNGSHGGSPSGPLLEVDVSSSSSSTNGCSRPALDDEFSKACWLLAEKTLERERAAGRGPSANPDAWLLTVYKQKRLENAGRSVREILADPISPERPEESTLRAQQARMDRDRSCPDCLGSGYKLNGEGEAERCEHVLEAQG